MGYIYIFIVFEMNAGTFKQSLQCNGLTTLFKKYHWSTVSTTMIMQCMRVSILMNSKRTYENKDKARLKYLDDNKNMFLRG